MGEKVIRPDRRHLDHRQDRLAALGNAVNEGAWDERRVHCWNLEPSCTEERRTKCAAYFVRRNCWDLWAAEFFPPGRKPCCHSKEDCADCATAAAKFNGSISVYVAVPATGEGDVESAPGRGRTPFHCSHLACTREQLTTRGCEGERRMVFRCRRRPGVVLHSTYVSEVCGTSGHRECNFYDTK